ncbi:galactitol-1-phosphate 5-dehydrogenase [Halalkalibacterium halodurans]|uniref:Sorbitol dehydrogenase n=1 Tax=Halalkalibacterium halodurans (strain ATCC BAA-125 / DSM 18197 / FERM 7344 / JCM 9153 / C-125) TaxID=272558 RepID=Q9KGB7_HALH5|nr:galactitol-1-phosphate 5-dehydrogenase [Halalkalibacterium halodurans]MED4081286.1 galactitol-1-phosphate 5-dehydrogenase [Halalkalibacterium halodurans]MED4084001.1 galactitol-1-phosphate 5-dehydrogenase [Halalkalibacterium halodurans]MED4105994.1 galactitol-1-phosphate 5-dehydrogenase [Halalkalibacterium halodurans]MED4107332.1 galactitol-1-phosphate 5-dehydrogenase [Halalkalibacterium halodurans]MED4148835.1 galactitol-1-phosphate 5-dehydrogenase [Halalkalibacterium halodurans]
MKALNLYGIQDLRFEETPAPSIEHDDDIIIKVKAVGICGSDLSRYKKLGPYVPGMTFGHEFAGEVVKIGRSVTGFSIGDRVAACPTYTCGQCRYCQLGEPTRCERLSVIGARHPGAYAEYVKLPAKHVIPLPNVVNYDEAALIEPASVVAHGFYRTNIKPGASVAIMGVGSIGLLAVQWAKIFGATTVFAIDIDEQKLNVANQLGADVLISSLQRPAHKQILEYTNGIGVDVAVESAGTPSTSAQVFALPKKGGEVVFLGIPYADVQIERFYFEKIVRNELHVYGSWNALSSPFPGKEWATTIHYMSSGQLNVAPMISYRLPLAKGPETFQQIAKGELKPTKVLFYPEKLSERK